MSRPKILLASPPVPECSSSETAFLGDVMAHRFTRGQSIFTLRSRIPYLSIHYLAGRLNLPSRVVEGPSLDGLRAVLKDKPEFVGISHYAIQAGLALDYCEIIRHESPESKIILGGFGTRWKEWSTDYSYLWDYCCTGEGVSFLRDLLDDRLPVRAHPLLPVATIRLPGVPFYRDRWGFAVAGLGCPEGCDFCSTTAFYGERKITLLSAEELISLNEAYRRRWKNLAGMFVIDENFLEGDTLENMVRIYRSGAEKIEEGYYFVFATLESLARTDPDDLLRAGIAGVFVGYESGALKKYAEHDLGSARRILEELAARGIQVILTFMCGLEHHVSKEVLFADISDYIALPSTMNQVSILTPFPGTKLAERASVPAHYQDYHFYNPRNSVCPLEAAVLSEAVSYAYSALYREQGPSLLRILATLLRGVEYCRRHPDPLVRSRAPLYERKARELAPLLDCIEEECLVRGLAWEISRVRKMAEDIVGIPSISSTLLKGVFRVLSKEPRIPIQKT